MGAQQISFSSLLTATAMLAGFLLYSYLGSRLLPGLRRRGRPQPGGGAVEYKLNGLALFLLTTAAVLVGHRVFDFSLTPILSHFGSLFVVANVVSLLWALWLVQSGRRSRGASGQEHGWLRDFWFGASLNPRLFGLDAKVFAYQPSLIGLWLVVVAFAQQQLETRGALTAQMWLFQGFWWAYFFTHYLREDFMLSTWDIIAERFGFMLVWGDLVFVPFFYSIAGWTLVEGTESWPAPAIAALLLFHVLGHWIFRESNWQKFRYRSDPEGRIWGRPARALEGKLLVSGWWGIGRKLNYTGEIMVYLSIALCAGFDSWVPYLPPLWLSVLLVHRAARDDRRCRRKYGDLWDFYCSRARFRMLPFVY